MKTGTYANIAVTLNSTTWYMLRADIDCNHLTIRCVSGIVLWSSSDSDSSTIVSIAKGEREYVYSAHLVAMPRFKRGDVIAFFKASGNTAVVSVTMAI